MIANVYDFDKTIFSKDSSVEFYKYCLKRKPSILKYIFIQLWGFIIYVFGFIDKTRFKEYVFSFLKGIKNPEEYVNDFWNNNEKLIHEWYYQKQKDNDVVISASPYFLIKPITERLCIKNVIATDVDINTGKFNSLNCYGDEKVAKLKEHFPDIEVDEFYSDSDSDLPLANISKKPFLVKKHKPVPWMEYKLTLKDKIKKYFFNKEFLAFLCVGAINALNGIWTAYVFSLCLDPISSFIVGYLISLTISYFLNSFLVFKSKLHIVKFLQFVVSYIPNFIIQNGLVLIFYYGLHFPKILVYALAVIIAIPITFLILYLFTFNKKNKENTFKEKTKHDYKSFFKYMSDWRKRTSLSQMSFDIAALIVMTIGIDILICSALFVLKLNISWYQLPLAFLISAGLLFLFSGRKNVLSFAFEIIIVLSLFALLGLASSYLYDITYDGENYHKLTVGLLRYGWNPIYEIPTSVTAERILGFPLEIQPWVEGYCKGTEIFSASMYAITNNIESTKIFNALFIIATFLVSYSLLRKKFNRRFLAILFAFLVASSPVAVSQMYSFYIDGFLYTSLVLLILYLFIWLLDNKANKPYIFSLIGLTMVICGNIKFTGLLLGGVFCVLNFGIFAVKTFIDNKKEVTFKKYIKKIGPTLLFFIGVAIVTICWAGSNSYVTNILRHHTIGYPITGEGAIDIMTNNSPFSPNSNQFVNLFQSLFSRVDNFFYSDGKNIVLKVPFMFDIEEIKIMCFCADTRLSGFGLFFSGIVILSLITFVLCCIKSKKNYETILLFANFLLCIFFIFVIKESWWARYAPYAYIALLIILYVALANRKTFKPLYVMAIITLTVFILNDVITYFVIGPNCYISATVANELASIKSATNGSISVYNEAYPGLYFNLLDQHFNITITDTLKTNPLANKTYYFNILWLPK